MNSYNLFYRELYNIATGRSVPKYLIRPDCECPRPFIDTMNLMQLLESNKTKPSSMCFGVLGAGVPRYTNQYQGKWAIFSPEGWMSNEENEARIIIVLPQPMQV